MSSLVATIRAEYRAVPYPERGTAPHLLLVEDDCRQRTQLSRMLAEEGYAVTVADSAPSALGLLRTSFDLLVTDVDLGSGISGIDLARMVGILLPDMPVIVLSARAPIIPDRSGLVYLRKPCTSARILAAVRTFVPIA